MVLLIFFGILLFLAVPLAEVTRITLGFTTSFTLLDITVGLGAIIWVFVQLYKKKFPTTLQAKTFILVSLFFAVSLLFNYNTLTTMQLITSSLYILRWVILGIIFFMVTSLPKMIRKKLPLFLFGSGILILLGGYIQYFFYPSLRNLIYFGWDEHFYRMFGTFFDPNFFGLFLVLFFLFIASYLFTVEVSKQQKRFVLLFLLESATGIGIILTYSRTALVALFVGLLVLFWKKHVLKWIVIGCVCIGFVLGVISLIQQATNTNTLFRGFSADARIGSAKDAITIFMDSPVVGVGFNAYRYSMYRHHFQPGSSIQEDHGASGADSSLLFVLATSGVIGLGLFILFLSSHIQALVKRKNRLGLAVCAATLVGSFFVNALFYPVIMVWFWVLLGITESGEQ